MKKFRKWVFLGAGIWVGLFIIFWSTTKYAYTGFVTSLVGIGLAIVIISKYWNNN